jgi:hypothetical protein
LGCVAVGTAHARAQENPTAANPARDQPPPKKPARSVGIKGEYATMKSTTKLDEGDVERETEHDDDR